MGPGHLLVAALLVAPTAVPPSLERVLTAELGRRPALTATDLYKLLHQSEFGPGHLLKDVPAARNFLVQEMEGVGGTEPEESLFEELGNGMVRLNLRPFKARNLSAESLLHAMEATSLKVRGEAGRLDTRLGEACLLLARQGHRDLAQELRSLARVQAAKGHPALHHSEAYRRAYRPAYRVILAQSINLR